MFVAVAVAAAVLVFLARWMRRELRRRAVKYEVSEKGRVFIRRDFPKRSEGKMSPVPMQSYRSEHHRGGRFQNEKGEPYVVSENKVVSAKLWSRYVCAKYDCKRPIPSVCPVKHFYDNEKSIRVFWIGHSTCLIKIEDIFIITDPVFANNAFPPFPFFLKRVSPLPCRVEELPKISLILLSHDHYDHMDMDSLVKIKEKNPNVVVFAPLRFNELLTPIGFNIIEFDWRESLEMFGIQFVCLPARHGSARGIFDQTKRLWCSWLLIKNGIKIYFPGDSAVGPHFKEINETFGGVDLAMMPIGPQEPSDTMKAVHMDPKDAYEMSLNLHAKKVFPIHYGTFPLGLEPKIDDITLLKKVWGNDGLSIIQIGEFLEWNGKEFVKSL